MTADKLAKPSKVCDMCGDSFSRTDSLNRHRKRKHEPAVPGVTAKLDEIRPVTNEEGIAYESTAEQLAADEEAMMRVADTLPCGHSRDRVENDEVAADEHERVCGENTYVEPTVSIPGDPMIGAVETVPEPRVFSAEGERSDEDDGESDVTCVDCGEPVTDDRPSVETDLGPVHVDHEEPSVTAYVQPADGSALRPMTVDDIQPAYPSQPAELPADQFADLMAKGGTATFYADGPPVVEIADPGADASPETVADDLPAQSAGDGPDVPAEPGVADPGLDLLAELRASLENAPRAGVASQARLFGVPKPVPAGKIEEGDFVLRLGVERKVLSRRLLPAGHVRLWLSGGVMVTMPSRTPMQRVPR